MQKETRRNSAAGSAKPNPPRKLTRAEKKQIAEIIRQAKGDGKAHTAQQTIPYIQMYPDGICKVTGRKYSKTVAFEDINYQLAQADDKTAIFENWCDFLKMCIRDRHCGECFDVFVRGKWKPTRIEYGDNWYLVGIRAEDLNGLRVRI